MRVPWGSHERRGAHLATTALILVLLAVPLAARAQQAGKVWRIGFLGTVPPPIFETFRDALRDLGWIEGRTSPSSVALPGGRGVWTIRPQTSSASRST